MQIEPRPHVSPVRAALAPVTAVLATMLLCSVLIIWADAPVLASWFSMLDGAVGSRFALTETLTRSIPLMFTGLAVAVAFRSKFYNIGAEGQLYCGALAVTYFGTGMVTLPPILMVPFLMLVAAIAGGAILIVPVLLKTRLRVDEVVTTLLLNFVILLFVSYLIEGPWKDPMAMGWPQAASIIDQGLMPAMLAKGRLHYGFVFALAAAILVWALMRFTVWGYEIKAVGLNATAAGFAGVDINKTIVRTAMISGGLAGLAGATEVAGLKGYLTLDLSRGLAIPGLRLPCWHNCIHSQSFPQPCFYPVSLLVRMP